MTMKAPDKEIDCPFSSGLPVHPALENANMVRSVDQASKMRHYRVSITPSTDQLSTQNAVSYEL